MAAPWVVGARGATAVRSMEGTAWRLDLSVAAVEAVEQSFEYPARLSQLLAGSLRTP